MSPEDVRPYVLLVDDRPANLVALEAVLGTSNYHLVSVNSGPEALAALEEHDFALILLDVQMPRMDGYEVARRIKSNPKTSHIPIVMITAIYREEPHVSRGYAAGAVDFFSKPYNVEVLKLKVGIYTDLYQKNLALRKKEEERRSMEQTVRALSVTIEERERERQKDEERRAAELRTILESIPDPIYVGDEKGITRCNSAALSMFGFESREQLNQHFETLAERIHMRYPETNQPIPSHDQPFSHALRGEQYISQVLIRHISSGEERVIACAAAPVIFEKQIIGAVVVNTDVPKQAAPSLGGEPVAARHPLLMKDGSTATATEPRSKSARN